VNPVVAVVLGWAVAGEPLTGRMLVAAAVILGGVALITLANTRGAARPAANTIARDSERFVNTETSKRRAG